MACAEIIEPSEVQRDETGNLILQTEDETEILDLFRPEVLGGLHVHRLGHALSIGNSRQPLHTGLIRVTSPNDAVYEAMRNEAEPDELPHHPV